MNKINTFIIGAQKAGTTSLYDWLGQHPEVDAPQEIKDYHFFTLEELFCKGYKHLDSFYKKRNSSVRLHAGVNYMYFHELAAKRIYEYNPDAKIIICLRNPVDRAVSAYNYFVQTLREDESFEASLLREREHKFKDKIQEAHKSYIGHGMYFDQINEFYKFFNSENVKVVLFEELTVPVKQNDIIKDICKFLKINQDFNFNFSHLNKSGMVRFKWITKFIRGNVAFGFLKAILPLSLKTMISKKIEKINTSSKSTNYRLNNDLRNQLTSEFKTDIEKTSDLIKLDLYTLWKIENH